MDNPEKVPPGKRPNAEQIVFSEHRGTNFPVNTKNAGYLECSRSIPNQSLQPNKCSDDDFTGECRINLPAITTTKELTAIIDATKCSPLITRA